MRLSFLVLPLSLTCSTIAAAAPPVAMRIPLVMAGPDVAARRVDATVLNLDLAPTILDLAGAPIPMQMQGRSLAAGQLIAAASAGADSLDEEEIVRARLSGLGYIS